MSDTDFVVSSGEIVIESQIAREDHANTQIPENDVQLLDVEGRITAAAVNDNTPSNAVDYSYDYDAGTDAPTRTLTDTQTVSGPNEQGEMVEDPWVEVDGVYVLREDINNQSQPGVLISDSGQPGIGAYDDAAPKNVQQQTVDRLFDNRIVPQNNVLDQFVTYTYELGWYILRPGEISRLFSAASQDRVISGKQCLVQSGGAIDKRPQSNVPNTGQVGETTFQPSTDQFESVTITGQSLYGRNEFFDLDFYFDDCEISSLLPGGGAGTLAAHQNTELRFRVIEPNGITLLQRLRQAVEKLYGSTYKAMGNNPANYVTAQYCLVIRFYGYDENGNPVQVGTTSPNGTTDDELDNYYIEKFIPFLIQDVKFTVQNKLVEYNITGKPIAYNFTLGNRGVIPFNLELTGKSVKEILVGQVGTAATTADTSGLTRNTQIDASDLGAFNEDTATTNNPGSTNTAPANANSAPGKKNNYVGLQEALNDIQRKHVKDKIYSIADEYVIEFAPESVGASRVAKPGGVNKKVVPMQQTTTAADTTLGEKQAMDTTSRGFSVLAGTTIIQFIDQLMKNSGYITQQQLQIVDEETGEVKRNGSAANQVAWYKVNVQAVPLQYDPLRRDFAYRLKYIISAYGITTLQSEYFPDSKFRGLHKRYSYWFTGENKSVLKFEQNYNALYQIVISGSPLGSTFANTYDSRQYTPRIFQPRSGQSDQGADGRTNEPAANAADYLYSPVDQADIKLRIIGDPAWLQQGEAVNSLNARTFNFAPFLPDGTINFDASEIAFDITWNRAQDYSLGTGFINPRPTFGSLDRENATYRATKIVSYFSRGSFEQDLFGRLLPLPPATASSISSIFSSTVDLGDYNEDKTTTQDESVSTEGGVRTSGTDTTTDNQTDVDNSPGTPTDTISTSDASPQPAQPPGAATSDGDIESTANDNEGRLASLGVDVEVDTSGSQLIDRET